MILLWQGCRLGCGLIGRIGGMVMRYGTGGFTW